MSGIFFQLDTPARCRDCLIVQHTKSGLRCPIASRLWGFSCTESVGATSRPPHCPIIPIPDHGDLIDRREAVIDANERGYDFWPSDDEVDNTIQFLSEQRAIMPADVTDMNVGDKTRGVEYAAPYAGEEVEA